MRKLGKVPLTMEVIVNRTYVDHKGCWIWAGIALNQYAYTSGTKISRCILEYFHGKLHRKQLACHHCDSPSCVNPEHLFIGSYVDNALDMHLKSRHPHTKLNPVKVFDIRSKLIAGFTLENLADEYQVSVDTIKDIRKRKTWKSIK